MDLQETQKSCGNAVVRQVIKAFDKKHFNEYVPLNYTCDNFLSMKKELEEKGQNATAYKEYVLPKKIEKNEMLIVQLLKQDITHFVLIEKIKNNKVIYFDPSIGLIEIGMDLFLNDYTGKAMVIKKGKGVKKIVKMPKLIDSFTKFLLIFLAMIRGISTLGFFFLISDSNYAKYSLIFLSTFVFSLLLTVLIIERKIKKNMESIVFPFVKITSINNYEDAMTIISSSYKLFETKLDKLVFIFVSFIFVLTQNVIFIWLFLITILMFVSVDLLTSKLLEKKKALSAFYETSFLNTLRTNNEETISKKIFKNARKTSFDYLRIFILSRLICLILLAVALIGFMNLVEKSSLSYFITTFAIFASIGFSVTSITNNKEESEIRKKMYRLGNSYTSYL